MARRKNPFTPSFGVVPPVMAGRGRLLEDMRVAFEDGVGNPNLSTIIVGARGTGKTALLSCIAEEARQTGWVCANVVAATGMLEDILQRAAEAAAEFVSLEDKKSLVGVSFAQILGLQWETQPAGEAPNWRTRMNALLRELGSRDIGLLITVDEVKASVPEMVQLASTYQLLIRDGHKVALVMAGLPKHASNLIANEDISFLRRSRVHYLGKIGSAEVESAFARTVREGGKDLAEGVAAEAALAIGGFPYMMQLVGYFSWMEGGESPAMSAEDVRRGIALARADLESSVLEATYRELSAGDRAFVAAMLPDEAGSSLADVARRMGKGNNYASTYKARLLDQGVIEETPGRRLAFSLPFFREYLEKLQTVG